MKSNLEYEWDLERNSREIVRLLLIYQLFEYIIDEIDFKSAQEVLESTWIDIKTGELERPKNC